MKNKSIYKHHVQRFKQTLTRTHLMLLCLCSIFKGFSQNENMIVSEGITVSCPAGTTASHKNHTTPNDFDIAALLERPKTAEFQITFGQDALSAPEAMSAYQFAFDIWSREIVSSVPIRVFAGFSNLSTATSTGILASAGPAYFVSDFSGSPEPTKSYPAALANALAGQILLPDTQDFELTINLNSSIDFYFGTDGNTPEGFFDFITVALHEIGHGLGFINDDNVGLSTAIGSLRSNSRTPSIYSKFLTNSNGLRAANLPDPSLELGAFLTSNDAFIDGTNTKKALGGQLAQVFAPTDFSLGSSVAHWDENAFPEGDPNALMTPNFNISESVMNIGNATRGLFKDMGWTLNNAGLFALEVTELTGDFEVNQGETAVQSLIVKNVSTQPFVYNAKLLNAPSHLNFVLSNAENMTLQPGAQQTVTITVNSTQANSGVFTATLNISTNTSSLETQRTLSIGILDGSETAILEAPSTIEDTIPLFDTENTNTVTLTNLGSQILTYSASVENDPNGILTLNTTSGSIRPNTSGILSYTYTIEHLSPGRFNASIVITSNASNTPVKTIPVQLIISDPERPIIGIDDSPIDLFFEADTPFLSDVLSLNLSNTGTQALEYNLDTFIESEFLVTSGTPSGTILPGDSQTLTFTVLLTSNAIGTSINSFININTNDPARREIDIPLHIAISRERGRLTGRSTTFGTLEVGSSKVAILEYENTGLAPVIVNDVLGDTRIDIIDWSGPNNSNIVEVGEVLSITARFKATRVSALSDDNAVIIDSDATPPGFLFNLRYNIDATVVAASGLAVSNDNLVQFLNLNVVDDTENLLSTQTLEITNVEATPINYTIALENADSSIFAISSSGGILEAGATDRVTVTFDATQQTIGLFENALNITINAQDTPEAVVDLKLNIVNEQGQFGEISPIFIDNFSDSFGIGFTEITNNSRLPIEISGFSLDINTPLLEIFAFGFESGDYIPGAPFTLLPNDTLLIDLNYIATTNGPIAANLIITSNAAPNVLKIPLEGVIEDELDPEVFAFQIVDVTNNAVLENFIFGETDVTIDLASYPNPVTLLAVTGANAPESIVFDYAGTTDFRTDNTAPFSLGDSVENVLSPFNFTLGTQTIKATPFSEANGQGFPFLESEITLTVIDSRLPFITAFVLVDTETNTAIKTIEDGDTIDLSLLNTTGVNLIAQTDVPVKSVAFDFNGTRRFDIFAPYSVGIDFKGNFKPLTLNSGDNTLTATPNILVRRRGFVDGNPKTLTFNVTGTLVSKTPVKSNRPIIFSVVPNPVRTQASFKIAVDGSQALDIRLSNLLEQELGGAYRTVIDAEGNGTLNMSGLQNGIYIFSIANPATGTTFRARLLKK